MHKKITLTILLLMFSWLSKLFSQSTPPPKSLWEQELEKRDPAKPVNFGYKCVWIAVKTEDTDSLLNALEVTHVQKANWVEGMLRNFSTGIFVLPPIDGWILAVGSDLPVPQAPVLEQARIFLDRLSARFGEAQLFGNHRGTGSAFWMKSVQGKTERLYSIGDGVTIIEGQPTAIEQQWALLDTNSEDAADEAYWDRSVYPDVEHVLEVAQAWSINPMQLETHENVGAFGYLGHLKWR